MPATRPFLTAHWRQVVMLNYEVAPALLKGRVPRGTELDAFNGRTYVSMVGFHFQDTRVRGIAIPFHRDFEEVNLRFYVRHHSGQEWRRGVVFIKEIVPRRAIAALARKLYNEPYIALPMGHVLRDNGDAPYAEYSWRLNGRRDVLSAQATGAVQPTAEGSLEQFIAEHYWGYTAQRDGGTMEYNVEHPPWRVWHVASSAFECDVAALYGKEFSEALTGKPTSAFLAEGSPVKVFAGQRLNV